MPTKWLQERVNGSKNGPGMPHIWPFVASAAQILVDADISSAQLHDADCGNIDIHIMYLNIYIYIYIKINIYMYYIYLVRPDGPTTAQ